MDITTRRYLIHFPPNLFTRFVNGVWKLFLLLLLGSFLFSVYLVCPFTVIGIFWPVCCFVDLWIPYIWACPPWFWDLVATVLSSFRLDSKVKRFAVEMDWLGIVNLFLFRLSLVYRFSVFFFRVIKAHSFVTDLLPGPSVTIWFLAYLLSLVVIERSSFCSILIIVSAQLSSVMTSFNCSS